MAASHNENLHLEQRSPSGPSAELGGSAEAQLEPRTSTQTKTSILTSKLLICPDSSAHLSPTLGASMLLMLTVLPRSLKDSSKGVAEGLESTVQNLQPPQLDLDHVDNSSLHRQEGGLGCNSTIRIDFKSGKHSMAMGPISPICNPEALACMSRATGRGDLILQTHNVHLQTI